MSQPLSLTGNTLGDINNIQSTINTSITSNDVVDVLLESPTTNASSANVNKSCCNDNECKNNKNNQR